MGYLRARSCLGIEQICSNQRDKEILVSYFPGEGGPQGFYEKLGFVPTGEMLGDEVVLRCDLAGFLVMKEVHT